MAEVGTGPGLPTSLRGPLAELLLPAPASQSSAYLAGLGKRGTLTCRVRGGSQPCPLGRGTWGTRKLHPDLALPQRVAGLEQPGRDIFFYKAGKHEK